MNQFVGFLDEFLDAVGPFDKTIPYVHIGRNKETQTVTAAAPTGGNSMEIRAEVKDPCEELSGVACLGNLMYLKKILGSTFVKKGCEIDLSFDMASNGQTQALKLIRFQTPKVNMLYQATDPFMANILRPSKSKITDWPVEFLLKKSAVKEFDEVKGIHGASKAIDGEEGKLFRISYANGEIMAHFGSKQQATLNLADKVMMVTGANKITRTATELKLNLHFLIDTFSAIVKLWEGPFNIFLCEKAMRVEYETTLARYQVTLTRSLLKGDTGGNS